MLEAVIHSSGHILLAGIEAARALAKVVLPLPRSPVMMTKRPVVRPPPPVIRTASQSGATLPSPVS